MSAIDDVLSKPVWPTIDEQQHNLFINYLGPLCVRGSSDEFAVGFNDTMRAVEQQKALAIFVARSDLNAAECMPLALASAAYNIPLITLQKGSRQKLGTGVACLLGGNEPLLRAVKEIGSAKLDWVYTRATYLKKNPPNKKQSK